MRAYSLNDVHATRKRRDSWWTVFLVDPVACRLTLFVANRTSVTPNGLTRLSLALGMGSAACFALGQLVAGAALFYVSFTVDCMDGKIARLKGTGTAFGLWLDYVGDRIRVVCCAGGLAFGQYTATGDLAYILLGAGVAVLDLFRYVNAPQMKRVREVVRENRAERRAELQAGLQAGPHPVERRPPRSARRPTLRRRADRFLARHRVRSHLISGIEFHAAVFVVAPLIGVVALLPVVAVAGGLLLLNEVFLIHRMWLFARAVPSAPRPESMQRVAV
ncbi:CDP-alcohol phosphatidyltransferase family protein [Streptosporangium pseudovulgare]|uniref:CDP-alcohol phosphatidyltransferase family protein n=1 Tax=Streptosporangium pseudovulgare TaxID=35765 RepID=UPI001E524884|nr:CDP-alcohol phosphatidyltransferase family protein [Streptosporangium pseudovulgare]